MYGLPQEAFATRARVSTRTLGYWEQHKAAAVLSAPSASKMDAMLARLDEPRRRRFHQSLRHTVDLGTGPGHGLGSCAAESLAFAEWAAAADAGTLTIESVAYQLSSIARRFVHSEPAPLLVELQTVRNRIETSLRTGPALLRTRDLLVLGGVAVELLAQVTDNLGDSVSAMQHAMAAEVLARKAGHDGLRAWTIGTQALIAEWNDDPAHAFGLAVEASTWAPEGDCRVRLAALKARCAARLGLPSQARDAVHAAIDAADTADSTSEDLAMFGGSMRFPTTKLAYYIGSTCRIIEDYPQAEKWALEAIDGYTTGPAQDRSYGDEAIARTDVAIARIAVGAIDGAAAVLAPVFKLPAPRRIYPITDGMRAVAATLHTMPTTNATPAKTLSENIAVFTATKLPELR